MPTREARAARRGDRGSAMILVIAVMVLVTGLAAVGTSMAISDQRGSGESQKAGRALNAAEAGIAQAINFVRSNGVRKLSCNLTTCPANVWSQANPVSANVAAGGRWSAWITPVSVGNGPNGDRYLVHSTGSAGGPAERTVETEITVTPFGLPNAVFGRTINLVGTVDMTQISMFSTGCVYKRDHVTINAAGGNDAAYNVPSAVHSSQIITESQGSGQYCPDTKKPIHTGLTAAGTSLQACNPSYPYDQDRLGGSLVGLPACAAAVANPAYVPRDIDADGTLDVNGSFIKDDRALFKTFGITRPILTDAQIEQLRTIAQSQGNYYTSTAYTVPSSVNPHAVLFFDLNGGEVNLDPLGGSYWSRARMDATNPACLDASLLVVITGGDAKLNSNTQIAAGIYLSGSAPYGRVKKANGTANHIGIIYGDTLDITGNFNISLDGCYIANAHPALFDVNPGTYRELDR